MTTTCPRCGQEHDPQKCTGHTSAGNPCKNRPIRGGTVCSTHGGSAPQVRAKAIERQQAAEADKVIAKMIWRQDAEPITNAVEALQRLAGQVGHALDALGGDLDLEALESQPVRTAAWLRLVREGRQLFEGMERLGIAERLVELEAGKVRLMAAALGRVFEVLELGPEQRSTATQVFLEELRAAADPGEPPVAGEVTS
jgi:ATP phosphoribosyltransferase regulatory subunit HisZ